MSKLVNQLSCRTPSIEFPAVAPVKAVAVLCAVLVAAACACAQTNEAAGQESANETVAPLVVDGVQAGDVFGLGKSVVVRGSVKQGVVAFGGDVIVEGRVEGDVAAVGGSIVQREGSYIGGDVIVLGGAYHHGKTAPGRNPASTTVMYAGYEEELRRMARDPTALLTPRPSPAFLGQRLLAALFWFIVSLVLTAAAPEAIGRAAARLQMTSLHVAVIGFLSSVVMSFGVLAALRFLPSMLGTLIGIMAILLLVVAHLFGRVVINAATGRWLQRVFAPNGGRSAAVALLLGAIFWTIIISLPYVWLPAIAGLSVTSLGLTLTARHRSGWKHA